MARRLGAIGAFAALAALALAGEASAAFPGANGKIAFVSYRDGDAEIFRMNPNGSDKERLTQNSAEDESPSFAPGGRRIVFASNRDGDFEIYVMRSNGTRQRQLTSTSNSAYDNSPSFSPNGKRILFTRVSERPGRLPITNLYVMRADGSQREAPDPKARLRLYARRVVAQRQEDRFHRHSRPRRRLPALGHEAGRDA